MVSCLEQNKQVPNQQYRERKKHFAVHMLQQ